MKIIITLLCFITTAVSAQVGIGTTSPDPSAVLHIESSDQGILIPNVSLSSILDTQLDGTNNAVEGLLIYNTNTMTTGGDGAGYYYYTSSNRWEKLMTPSSEIGLAPIGSIIAWHGSLAGVGALPNGWQLCDGSTVSDTNSPLNGRSTPNLNGNTTSSSGDSSGGRFLRGSRTSGFYQADQTNNLNRIVASTASSSNSTLNLNQNGAFGYISTDEAIGSDRYEFSLRGVETRVTNMAVIWIIRIK